MCGLVSIFNYRKHQAVDRQEVLRIRDKMHARGPDAEGYWQHRDGMLAMGHRRLSILDLSDNGLQPMQTQNGRFTIVLNGEIYNYRELRADLVNRGYTFQSDSDTEVLLHLYAEYGESMLHRLRGMFAFTLWDDMQQRLLIARDAFGVKPLYIADDGYSIRIASQLQALIAGGAIDTAINAHSQVSFFMWGHVPEPDTWYDAIKVFPAGCYAWVTTNGLSEHHKFFNISAALSTTSDVAASKEALHQALLDSVQHHFVSDVPVGLFLSSGLDSSLLLALARELGIANVKSMTLGFAAFKGSAKDETILAERLAQQYASEHHTVWLNKADLQQAQTQILDAMDQPTIDGVNTYFISSIAKQLGMKVALSGLGGDELFGGYDSFKQIPKLVKYFTLMRYFPRVGTLLRAMLQSIIGRFTSNKYASLLEYGYHYSGAYLLRRGLYMPWELRKLFPRAVIASTEQHILNQMEQDLVSITQEFNKIRLLESRYYMRNQLLRDTDWSSMAHSVEVRVPFVDKSLFDVARRIPLQKISKPFACSVLQQALPDYVLSKSKTGFFVPSQQLSSSVTNNTPTERGYRNWAKQICQHFGGVIKEAA